VPRGGLGAASSRPKCQMGIGRPQPGGSGERRTVEPGALNSGWGAGFPIWASGLASTSGFSAVRRHIWEAGPNGAMRHIFRAARAGGKFIKNCMGIKCYKRGFR
jgi:hypothetical protein